MTAELFDLSDDVPRFVVGDVLHDVSQDPLEHGIGGAEVSDELVDSEFLHLIVVEANAQVGGEVELTGHVPHDTLEEGVDGLHTEVVVVIEEVGETDARPFADDLRVEARLFLDGFHVVIGVG